MDYSVWQKRLDSIAAQGLRRDRTCLQSKQSVNVDIDGQSYLNFASNDYLGLASDKRIVAAAQHGLAQYGFGSGASDVVCGHFDIHETLERELAEFTGRDKALLFSTGYMANLAVSAAFCDSNTLLMQDKFNHASLIDGGRLSGARSQRYLHNDSSSLQAHLTRLTGKQNYSNVVISTDGVFSMDGDVADLKALSDIACSNNALLIVDDAHGLGVLGRCGRGSIDEARLSQDQCHLLVGTFGKAFGGFGAFVAGPEVLINYLQQVARTHIYTTAMPPSNVAAMRESLSVIRDDDVLRAALAKNIAYFSERMRSTPFECLSSSTAIQGVVVGDNDNTMALAHYLKRHGVIVGAIRPPTVAPNSARLRITLTAKHSFADIDRVAVLLMQAIEQGIVTTKDLVSGGSNCD